MHPELIQKVALDQLVFSPTFLAVFFTYNGLMEGQGISGVKQKFKTVPSANSAIYSGSNVFRATLRPLLPVLKCGHWCKWSTFS